MRTRTFAITALPLLTALALLSAPAPGSADDFVRSTSGSAGDLSLPAADTDSRLAVERVDVPRQLMITDLRVIEDPIRTNPSHGSRAIWTFQHLMTSMAGAQDPSDFTLRWLKRWETDQFVNGQLVKARPSIRQQVIDPWLRASGGRRLDLAKAPFKLLAIVNRMDLRAQDRARVDTAGEGRFVFGVLAADGKPLPPLGGTVPGGFVVIFEYELIATSMAELRTWAQLWRGLGELPLGSPQYNFALERITRRFSDPGSAPRKPNRNAINQLRTNEVALGIPWELREFHLGGNPAQLLPSTVAVTPGTVELNGTQRFTDLINQNEAELLAGTFSLAPAYLGAAALSGPFQPSDFPDFLDRTFTKTLLFDPFYDIPWSAAGIRSNDARHAFALNTCGGCHRGETGTDFLQVGFPDNHQLPRSLGSPAKLAGFLTGIKVADPVEPAVTRQFADLARRRTDLEELFASFFDPNRFGLGPIETRHMPSRVH